MNNGAEVGQGGDGRNAGIQNPADPLPWILSDDDTPHVVLSGFTWEVPGPQRGVMRQVLGGWNVSGILRYESGRPMTITMTNDLAGLLFNTQKRPNQVGEGKADFGDFDPFKDRYFNRAGWADPGPLQFGNAPERDGEVRGFPNFSEDINIFKVFPFSRPEETQVRAPDRQLLQPHDLLQSRGELERDGLRAGVHAVQHRALRSTRVPVRFLVRGAMHLGPGTRGPSSGVDRATPRRGGALVAGRPTRASSARPRTAREHR